MNRRHTLFASTGIPSLFLIFAVLCMAVFSLLTLGSSRSELNSARLSMEQTEQYYNACQKAADTVAEIQEVLQTYHTQASNKDEFMKLAGDLSSEFEGLAFDDSSDDILILSHPFSDTQSLLVRMQILYPQTSADKKLIKILQWKTVITADWNPDTSQSVYNPKQEE